VALFSGSPSDARDLALRLVWSDEFDRDGLPDSSKWDYEVGYVRNSELQYYTKARLENARVEKGTLIIEGRKDDYTIPEGPLAGKTAACTSASLITRGRASWRYGRLEVRARLPHGRGVWPAIWTLGNSIDQCSWPACGETDIMEFVGHTPGRIYATVHYLSEGRHSSSGSSLEVTRPWDDFHVYALEWTPEKMEFYFDSDRYHTFQVRSADDRGRNPFRLPHYLLLNLALGGTWGGVMDDSALPQRLLVDYVRVYQRPGADGR
jgi:beta-glucanase (GH16 family)